MMELVIGREAGTDKPRLAVTLNGKTVCLGTPGSVPKSVSRRHCKVTVGDDSLMTVENLTVSTESEGVQNIVYVDGKEYVRRGGVPLDASIELGPDHYRLDVRALLKAVAAGQAYSIGHLEKVYQDYQQEKLDLQIRQGKLNAISALPGVLSMTSIGLAVFIPNARVVMIVIAAVFALVFAFIRYKNASKVPLKTREIEDRFREKYICPNPVCNHFLGAVPYKELLKNHHCPYCKCKFSE